MVCRSATLAIALASWWALPSSVCLCWSKASRPRAARSRVRSANPFHLDLMKPVYHPSTTPVQHPCLSKGQHSYCRTGRLRREERAACYLPPLRASSKFNHSDRAFPY
ncbi:hypothetical protein FPV67DRAFT_1501510 [Lyophyllum atratum]|nr:hypothetical protein FPV67DRAFT_1501510 [Lyophyllum atratum]